jgi:hypothetical protein
VPPPSPPYPAPPEIVDAAPAFLTVVTMTASGDVADYTASVQAAIVANFASAAGVAQSRVSLRVSAASVRLEITIESASKAAADAAQSSLAPALADASATADLMPAGFTVESTPTIAVVAAPEPGTTLSPPPPSRSPTPSASSLGGVLGGGVGGAAILLVLILLLWKRRRVSRRAKTGDGASTEDAIPEAAGGDVATRVPMPTAVSQVKTDTADGASTANVHLDVAGDDVATDLLAPQRASMAAAASEVESPAAQQPAPSVRPQPLQSEVPVSAQRRPSGTGSSTPNSTNRSWAEFLTSYRDPEQRDSPLEHQAISAAQREARSPGQPVPRPSALAQSLLQVNEAARQHAAQEQTTMSDAEFAARLSRTIEHVEA